MEEIDFVMLDLARVKNALAWAGARQRIEASLLEVLGTLPKDNVDLQIKTADELEFPGYVRRRINYFTSPWERVAAWLFIPEGKEEAPAILCCHDQVKQGKDQPAGLDGDSKLALAQHYAELGYVTLAPDCLTAGDRLAARKKAFDTTGYYKDNTKLSFAGKMLVDHMRALDVFSEVRRVDAARVGVAGHGLGAFNALLLTAFDDRVRACVASCGFTRFASDEEPQRWTAKDDMALLPALAPMIDKGDFAFDWEHILAMAAPSAVLAITSLTDSLYSEPQSCQKAVDIAARIYKHLGAGNALSHLSHRDGHHLAPATLEAADDWFERWL